MSVGRRVDEVVGGLSRILHGLRGAEHDTLADLASHYYDLPIATMFPPPPAVPSAKRQRSILWHALRTMTIEWESTHEVLCPTYRRRHHGEHAKNLVAQARWLRPRKKRQEDCLLYVHGWLEPGSWVEEAVLFPPWTRALDVDILHLALPFHGPRNSPGALFSGEFFWTGDMVRSLEAVRQAVHDARSAMAWLRAQGYRRVGVTGLSLGGAIVMMLACLEPLPDFIVPIIAHLDVAHAVEHAPIMWRVKDDLERFGLDAAGRGEMFRRVGLSSFTPRLPPARQLWIQARDDAYIDAGVAERQWTRWGEPPILWLNGGHMTVLMELERITERLASFHRELAALPRSPVPPQPARKPTR